MNAVRAEAGTAQDARVAEAPSLSRTKLAWLQATGRRGWAVAVWLCLSGAIAMPALLPLIDAVAVRSALAQTLAHDGSFSVEQNVADAASFNAFKRDVDAAIDSRTGSALLPIIDRAATGPLKVTSVNSASPPAAAAQRPVLATYIDHLATHVGVNAGELPPDALGGGDTAVTMPQAAADQFGLRLSDRVCFDFAAGGSSPWCARIVGLWQPLDTHDPYWNRAPAGPVLAMGLVDFFDVVRQHPGQAADATLGYWANSDAVDPGQAGDVSAQIKQLTAQLQTPQRHVSTSLGTSLQTFHATQLQVSTAIHLTAAAITMLGLFVVGLVGARFLDGQARELAVLRARGWPSGRVWRAASFGLGALVLCALPIGLGAGLLFLAVLSSGGSGLSAGWLHREDVLGVAVAMAGNAVGLIAVLALLALGAARRELDPALEGPFRRTRPWWRRAGTALLLGCAGTIELALPKAPVTANLISGTPGPLPTLLGLAPVLGLILLTAAVVHLLPLGWAVRRNNVARALARWQLRRSPEQHTGAGFVLILAVAISVFAALGLAEGPRPQPELGAGLQAGLLVGAVVASALALAAFGLHYRSVARRRRQEYGGLFAHGLAPPEVGRSVATEQASATTSALVVGTILGIALAVSGLPLATPAAGSLEVGAAGVAGALACLFLCMRVVGAIARRLPAHGSALGPQRQQ